MTYAAIASSWALVLVLVLALLWGQPAGLQTERARATAQSTEVATLKATVTAYPTPASANRNCGHMYGGYPFC